MENTLLYSVGAVTATAIGYAVIDTAMHHFESVIALLRMINP